MKNYMKQSHHLTWSKRWRIFGRQWQLHLLILIPMAYLGLFHFVPLYGIQIAFRDYRPLHGIIGSEWVGLKWFQQFLSNYQFGQIFMNTLILSLYSFTTFPLPILFALVLHAIKNERYTKIVQTVAYVPHFISTSVMVGMIMMLLSPVSGLYGNLYRLFGGVGYPVDFRASAAAFRHLHVWSGVWQSLGWSTIIYTAALSSVSQELHEAAQLDGASRLKRMWHVDIPAIMPTIAIQFILRCTGIISVGFEKAYLLQTSLNKSVSEVISTYVYSVGMASFRSFSYGAAVGLFNTVINLGLLLTANFIVRKATENEIALF
ncbi:MAG: sugar ABC transporter permease [Lachnospiraceae bacterium]|nr:sugar ABC transporter permease [Lachnospiraceae bacterium]